MTELADRSHKNPKDTRHIVRFPRLIRRFPRLPIETKKETYYVVRCKSSGTFWYESLDDSMAYHSFEKSPLHAAPVGQDPGDFEVELEAIEKYLPKGEFDASDFELVKVDVSYTLSPP